MKTFKNFITEEDTKLPAKDWLEARNALVDVDAIVLRVVKGWKFNPDLTEKDAKKISDWAKTKKTFSLNSMFDAVGSDAVSYGLLKEIIKELKSEFTTAGFSKAGNISKTLSSAERIDKYLKQKWIRK